MGTEVAYPARVRIWKQTKTWRKPHPAKGPFAAVNQGDVEELRLPVYIHPCSVCGCSLAPFGIKGIWYCKEHRP